MASATTLQKFSSPILASQNQNFQANLTTEVVFAALPAAPAAGILYDVVSTANASDCKVSACGNTGDPPNKIQQWEALPTTQQTLTFLFH